MAATTVNIDPSQTTDEATSQPLLKIQSTNYRVQPNVYAYPNELKMLIVSLNHSVLSTVMSTSFSTLLTWLSLVASTTMFKKTTKVVTFQLTNEKIIYCPRSSLPTFWTFLMSNMSMRLQMTRLFICSTRWVINYLLPEGMTSRNHLYLASGTFSLVSSFDASQDELLD